MSKRKDPQPPRSVSSKPAPTPSLATDADLHRIVERIALAESREQFQVKRVCFYDQSNFITDPIRFKTAACSRRAGKTFACAVYLLTTALVHPGSNSIYITLSRANAKRIVWKQLLELNRKHALGGKPNETDLTIEFPSGSTIYLTGAKDKVEIEKFRGLSLKLVIIDETQSFRPYLKELVDDIITPCLWDVQGTLALVGTPGPLRAGTFFDACHSREWSNHHWTILENVHIARLSGKEPGKILEEERLRRGITETDPTYLRESLGQWAEDSSSLVFKYSRERNHYASLPDALKWNYVIGVDIGHDDADAIAVLGWNENSRALWLVEEHVKTKQTITELGNAVTRIADKYAPEAVVIDTGGLGKKIAEELKERWQIYLTAAEKSRKLEHIELVNDALRTGLLRAKGDSLFAQDCALVQWEPGHKGSKVSDSFHSDITDALLYAFRACKHWLTEIKDTSEEREMDEWELREMARMEARKGQAWWEQDGALG